MLDVKNKEETGRILSKIKMGDLALKFNMARFILEDDEVNTKKSEERRQPEECVNVDFESNTHNESAGQSIDIGRHTFCDTLLRRNHFVNQKGSVSVDDNVNSFFNLHGKALVVKLMDMDALKNFRMILKKISLGGDKIQYLGGLSVLLSFSDNRIVTPRPKGGKRRGVMR